MEDFDTLSLFRKDGRKEQEMRKITIESELDSFTSYSGCSRFKQGTTEVICYIDGPKHKSNYSQNIININFHETSFSNFRRKSTNSIPKYW